MSLLAEVGYRITSIGLVVEKTIAEVVRKIEEGRFVDLSKCLAEASDTTNELEEYMCEGT